MTKKSFVIHLDSLDILDELNNEQAGLLFKAIKDYHVGNELELDFALKIAFIPFKNQFLRDVEKYEEKVNKTSNSGRLGNLKRWHEDLYNKVIDNQITIEQAEHIANANKQSQSIADATSVSQIVANIADSVNDSDSDSDSVNDNKNKTSVSKETIDFDLLLRFFNKTTKKNFKKINDKTKRAFNARIKEGYTKSDIMKAIVNCSKDSFHIENPNYLTPEFISRPDKLEKYLNAKPSNISNTQSSQTNQIVFPR